MARRLVVAIFAVVALMSALAWIRWSIWSYGADTGTFAQSILNAFGGFANSIEPGGTHLRTHWSPIIAILWPIVAITRSPLSIQIAQAVLVALAAVPLYAIAKRYAGDRWAWRCSILALIYPPLLSNAFSEFHELAFFPVIVLSLFWAADAARWGWFALFAVAGVTIREDACATLFVFGIALAAIALVARKSGERGLLYGEPEQPRTCAVAGLSLAALSAAVLALYAFAILPHLGRWTPVHFYASGVGGSLANAAFGRVTYVLELLAPLAFLPLFSRWSLLALPPLIGILAANDGVVWRMGSHYVLLTVPWLLLGAADVLVRQDALRWWRSATALCFVFLIAFDPMHPVHYLRAEPYQHSADAERAMACVPREARVATHDEWLAHYALQYPHITQFRSARRNFRGYLVYASDWQNGDFLAHDLPKLRAGSQDARYGVICKYGTVVVLSETDQSVSRMKRNPVKPASRRAASPI